MVKAITQNLPRGKGEIIPNNQSTIRQGTGPRIQNSDELFFGPGIYAVLFVKALFRFYLEFLIKRRNIFVRDERRSRRIDLFRPFPHIRLGCIRLAKLPLARQWVFLCFGRNGGSRGDGRRFLWGFFPMDYRLPLLLIQLQSNGAKTVEKRRRTKDSQKTKKRANGR